MHELYHDEGAGAAAQKVRKADRVDRGVRHVRKGQRTETFSRDKKVFRQDSRARMNEHTPTYERGANTPPHPASGHYRRTCAS